MVWLSLYREFPLCALCSALSLPLPNSTHRAQDSVPAFAPSLKTMLSNFNDVYEDAGRAWCGLEAKFMAPNGNEALLVIGDAFDDAWVLSPGSVDIIYESFAKLYGKETSNKEDVIKEVSGRVRRWCGGVADAITTAQVGVHGKANQRIHV